MSLTYGYDLKDGDKILEVPIQVAKILEPLIVLRGALINHFPICAIMNFVPAMPVVPHSIFSAAHSFMGPISQLRTIGANR